MKTLTPARTLTLLAATLALGSSSVVALAGPSAQYSNKSPSTPAAKSASAGCGACSDTIKWKISDRGPAGKGVASASVAGRTHQCTSCAGAIVRAPGQTTDTMTRTAACGTVVCCK